MNLVKAIGVLLSAALLGGCAVGQSEFNCSAGDENALCGSSRTIYRATDGTLVTNDTLTYIEDGEPRQITLDELKDIENKQKNKKVASGISEISTYGAKFNYVPQSFSFDGDVLRKDVKVLRVWVAPFVDTNDDLHLSSMVYTDIEQRSWELGTVNPNSKTRIAPPVTKSLVNPSKSEQRSVKEYRVPKTEKAKLQTTFDNN